MIKEDEDKIKELEENIKKWREELNTVWKGKDTDVARTERRNLNNLIMNAEREINKLKGIEVETVSTSPEDIKKAIADMRNIMGEKGRLKISIEKLEEEKKLYENPKNKEYEEIYKEYDKKIEKVKQESKEIEKKEKEVRDKSLKVLTQAKMKEEKEIKEIEKKIKQKEQEISDIEYGTEEAMEEKELKDGTKVKVPRVFNKYKELDELKKSLKERTDKRDEYQKYINEFKGIEKEEKPEYTAKQNEEYTKYFHGQGDIPENTRDDRRGNDEYSGFEKSKNGKKPIEPVGVGENSEGKASKGKEKTELQVIEIDEKSGNIFFKDSKGNSGNIDIEYALKNKKDLLKKLSISKMCREVAGGRLRGFLLKRKLNPEVLMVLDGYQEQTKSYISSIKNKQKGSFDIVHNLEGAKIFDKLKMNKYVRAERKSGAIVLGGIFTKKISEGLREKAKMLVEGNKEEGKKKDSEWSERVDNRDNHIEREAVERIQKECEADRAREVQDMMK